VDEFDIYIRGFLPGREESVEAGLCRVFGLDGRRAREFVKSLPRVVKRSVAAEHASRYERVLRELGADCELRRSVIRPAQVIAVAGSDREAAAELHGSTLTLPPPQVTEPAPAHAVPVPLEARPAQFAATVVDRGPPAAMLADRTLAPHATPSHVLGRFATMREGSPSTVAALPPAPVLGIAKSTPPPYASPPPPPARLPPSEAPPPAAVPPASPLAGSVWAPIPLASPPPAAPAFASPHALASPAQPASSVPSASLPPPEPPSPQGTDGRPDWFVDGANLYRTDLIAPPSAAAASPERHGAPASAGAHEPALASAPPGTGAQPSLRAKPSAQAVVRPAFQPRPIGVVVRREADPEPPLLLRIGLRLAAGLALFLMYAALRSAFDGGVKEALAEWSAPASTVPAPAVAREPRPVGGYGPRALEWMESDLHQFTSGDKDAVGNKVRAYKAAGAIEVYVGTLMRSGPAELAGELIIELPSDPQGRKAVLAEHQRVLDASFGGFAPKVEDQDAAVLRVTL
jgi:hypothetical protein